MAAAETQAADRAVAEAARDQTLERGLGPAVAVVAIEAERVPAFDQVADGLDADRGAHAGRVDRAEIRG
jgi:hypothetical protein